MDVRGLVHRSVSGKVRLSAVYIQARSFRTVFLNSVSQIGDRCWMGGWLPAIVSELVNLHGLEQQAAAILASLCAGR